jgi:hypothetical protein
MTMSTKLFSAILAMDSYNRGYNAALPGLSDKPGTQIGNATITAFDGEKDSNAVASGFYGIAYDWGGTTVISFRGTDFGSVASVWDAAYNGWVTGAGSPIGNQATLAETFYKSVTKHSVFDGYDSDVLLVGHSLGGGLGPEPGQSNRTKRIDG